MCERARQNSRISTMGPGPSTPSYGGLVSVYRGQYRSESLDRSHHIDPSPLQAIRAPACDLARVSGVNVPLSPPTRAEHPGPASGPNGLRAATSASQRRPVARTEDEHIQTYSLRALNLALDPDRGGAPLLGSLLDRPPGPPWSMRQVWRPQPYARRYGY